MEELIGDRIHNAPGIEKDLAGAMIWAIDCDQFNSGEGNPLQTVIKNKLINP